MFLKFSCELLTVSGLELEFTLTNSTSGGCSSEAIVNNHRTHLWLLSEEHFQS
jgi:hypothetical protein